MSSLGESFVAAAREYLDVPWHHQGRNHAGIDCVGLVVNAARAVGIPVANDVIDYPLKLSGRWIEERLDRYCAKLDKRGAHLVGDILVFRMALDYWHVGIVTGEDPVSMIHSYRSIGHVVEQRLAAPFTDDRLGSAWRLE